MEINIISRHSQTGKCLTWTRSQQQAPNQAPVVSTTPILCTRIRKEPGQHKSSKQIRPNHATQNSCSNKSCSIEYKPVLIRHPLCKVIRDVSHTPKKTSQVKKKTKVGPQTQLQSLLHPHQLILKTEISKQPSQANKPRGDKYKSRQPGGQTTVFN